MSVSIPKNTRKILVQEIHRWQQEQIISNDVTSKLLSMYPEVNPGGGIAGILMTIGAVLIGLGAILFIASNWSLLPAIVKIGMIIGATVGAYSGGWYFKFEPGNRPKLGSSLLLLGSLLYGAGIWLISQIYNLDTNLGDGLFIWAIGVFPLALVTRSLSLGVLSVVLWAVWGVIPKEPLVGQALLHAQNLVEFVIALGAGLILSYRLRSSWCLTLTLLFCASWIIAYGRIIGLLSAGVTFLAAYFWHENKDQYFAANYLIIGLIVTLGSLTGLTFQLGTIDGTFRTDALIAWVCSWTSLLYVATKRKDIASEVLFLGVVLISGLLPLFGTFTVIQALISNTVLLAMLLGLMFSTSNRHKSAIILNTAVVFLVIDIICRYFDFFFKTIDRSLFFVAGGFVFLIAATVLEQNRRKLLEGFTK